jgi:hypothetical protein
LQHSFHADYFDGPGGGSRRRLGAEHLRDDRPGYQVAAQAKFGLSPAIVAGLTHSMRVDKRIGFMLDIDGRYFDRRSTS